MSLTAAEERLTASASSSLPAEAVLPSSEVKMDEDDENKNNDEKKKVKGKWQWVYNDYCEHCNHHHYCTGPTKKKQAKTVEETTQNCKVEEATSSASAAERTPDAEMQDSTKRSPDAEMQDSTSKEGVWQDWAANAWIDKKEKKMWTMDEWKTWSDAKSQKEADARQAVKTDIWNKTLGTRYPVLRLP
jgi:hypothetical protein